ncbi:Pycsar system effector family protein [Mycolicibacter sp. MYC123]|uniref:Pycsar system effector family protein n=1 Tax=[Mycobacterium] zoologicum TaxID=2872311 RepID=A0ABU5YGR2_9MYCO|nr:Pycsar system effector family protein [Mycolicibacter sp. MYC123]MEB3049050.1 Pycsar system effector family protein [Mycolicibacter sp. MYC123]
MPSDYGSSDAALTPPESTTNNSATPDLTGSVAAIDQMAEWARFGDTKATILAAGLGVVATMFATNAPAVLTAMHKPCPIDLVVGGLALITLLAFMWTLFWVVRAIAPRSEIPYEGLNRFAWPSVARVTAAQLVEHAQRNNIEVDAWQQVVDLSKIAKRKFEFCKLAVYGFGVTIATGVLTVILSAPFTPPKS